MAVKGNFTAYPTKRENWNESVRFCNSQDGSISSVENVRNGRLLNVTESTYWVSVIRRISVQGKCLI